ALCSICFLLLSLNTLLSEDNKKSLHAAVDRIKEIRSLPEKQFLQTLDGQSVLLEEFHTKCLCLFPSCILFEKFYYWKSEIREVVSHTANGEIKHKIRYYRSCLSRLCPTFSDPHKTHGDVAEFYDQKGEFMGLAVYMGNGKYCSLPYSGYEKE
ncbi:MAG: hypothetical protein P8Y00_08735, partial [Deltaproteobacteria bacterium]